MTEQCLLHGYICLAYDGDVVVFGEEIEDLNHEAVCAVFDWVDAAVYGAGAYGLEDGLEVDVRLEVVIWEDLEGCL